MKAGEVLSRAQTFAARHRRPIGFLLVGGVNTLFGLALYPIMLWCLPVLQAHYLVALLIAQIISIAFAYMMYKRTVFRTKGNIFREVWQFSSFYLLIFAINWAVLPVLVERAGIAPMLAQFGFSLVGSAASYLWHSRLTFRARDGDPKRPNALRRND